MSEHNPISPTNAKTKPQLIFGKLALLVLFAAMIVFALVLKNQMLGHPKLRKEIEIRLLGEFRQAAFDNPNQELKLDQHTFKDAPEWQILLEGDKVTVLAPFQQNEIPKEAQEALKIWLQNWLKQRFNKDQKPIYLEVKWARNS